MLDKLKCHLKCRSRVHYLQMSLAFVGIVNSKATFMKR
jgi:hypothetical protein